MDNKTDFRKGFEMTFSCGEGNHICTTCEHMIFKTCGAFKDPLNSTQVFPGNMKLKIHVLECNHFKEVDANEPENLS